MSDVVIPDQVKASGAVYANADDPHAANRRALSPCPVCGVNAHEGPEGESWVQFPHCWSCGFNHLQPAAPQLAGAAPAMPQAAVAAAAQAIADQVREMLGLGAGERLVGFGQAPAHAAVEAGGEQA
jgi:hypothetical protein